LNHDVGVAGFTCNAAMAANLKESNMRELVNQEISFVSGGYLATETDPFGEYGGLTDNPYAVGVGAVAIAGAIITAVGGVIASWISSSSNTGTSCTVTRTDNSTTTNGQTTQSSTTITNCTIKK
jgi:hypothetical protein